MGRAVRLTVDGARYEVSDAQTGQSLLRVLRDVLGLTSAKNACEQGECGSCTVAIDGEIACACLVLAAQADGASVETAASLAGPDGTPHAVQGAFLRAGAVQCGFCTPGLVVAARDLLARNPDPSEADIREGLNGNLCRCTGYQKIVEAVRLAAQEGRA
ncbi:MAG: aerobic carbon-monoxide dehydrogenase small subunit [Baekduia sp.]|nr:aerobic carbon-monoxide dehydrogenase small subunit [Baekduia sp.]